MSVWIVAFTLRGAKLAARLAAALPEARAWAMEKYAAEANVAPVTDLRRWCAEGWREAGGLVFVGAAGIAVRTIAPLVESKTTDPAVVVVDERGQFAISLLSGHIGGANRLTREAAAVLGAVPVITTATDVNHKFAVDVFAVKNRLHITSMALARDISAAILAGEQVGLLWDGELKGTIPAELTLNWRQRLNIEIGLEARLPDSLLLIPRCIHLGIGCKRGTEASAIAAQVSAALERFSIPAQAVMDAASIDLKRDEAGLLQWADQAGLLLRFYSAEALRAASGEFTVSEFVEKITGVDSVCERAAVLASGGGALQIRKQASGGVTVAAARTEVRIEL